MRCRFLWCNWNENNLMNLSRTNWRASLVPAAAVIPAPIAYTKVVAVKKLVVWFRGAIFFPPGFVWFVFRFRSLPFCAGWWMHLFFPFILWKALICFLRFRMFGAFTLKKLECSKQADFICLNRLAWNNRRGLLGLYFVGRFPYAPLGCVWIPQVWSND